MGTSTVGHICDPKPLDKNGMIVAQCGCGRYFEASDFLGICSCGCRKPLVYNKSKEINGKWYLNNHAPDGER